MTGDAHFGWGGLPLRLDEDGPPQTKPERPADDWDPREEGVPPTTGPDTVRRPGGGTPSGPRGPETDGVTVDTD